MIQASVTSYPHSSPPCAVSLLSQAEEPSLKSIPNRRAWPNRSTRRPDQGGWPVASTRETAFAEMPGAAPDIMRDYDLATLGLRGDRVQLRGHGGLVRVAGRAGCRRPLGRDPGCRGSVPDPVRGALALGPAAVQRDGRGRVAQRLGRHRRRARLGVLPSRLTAAGHAWVGVSAQKVGIDGGGFVESIHLKLLAPERYEDAGASRRRLVLRHLHAGRPVAPAAERREPAGRPDADADPGRGRVAVGRLPGDLHQRRRSRTRSSSTASSCTAGRRRACPSTACSSRRRHGWAWRRRGWRSRRQASASVTTPGCRCSCCRARPT